VSCWAKVVALIVIAVIAFVLIAPDIDLYPTVSRVSHAVQKPSNAVFHSAVPVAVMTAISISALSAQFLSLCTKGDSCTNLIDLKCSRLC
jgi:glycine cleavage system regulatory protein